MTIVFFFCRVIFFPCVYYLYSIEHGKAHYFILLQLLFSYMYMFHFYQCFKKRSDIYYLLSILYPMPETRIKSFHFTSCGCFDDTNSSTLIYLNEWHAFSYYFRGFHSWNHDKTCSPNLLNLNACFISPPNLLVLHNGERRNQSTLWQRRQR